MKRATLVWLLRRFDPELLAPKGMCLAGTDSHEACPLYQLAQEKKIVRKQEREEASL